MEKKPYVKPTLERQAIFSYEGGYLGLGGKLSCLYFDAPKKLAVGGNQYGQRE